MSSRRLRDSLHILLLRPTSAACPLQPSTCHHDSTRLNSQHIRPFPARGCPARMFRHRWRLSLCLSFRRRVPLSPIRRCDTSNMRSSHLQLPRACRAIRCLAARPSLPPDRDSCHMLLMPLPSQVSRTSPALPCHRLPVHYCDSTRLNSPASR